MAVMTRSASGAVVIDLSASASSPPLTPASAMASTATPKPGRVTPVKYLNAKPSAHEASAGMTPTSSPR
jgi:hypothetical protein